MPGQNSLLGAAGEHYVLSCLLRQGYTAGFAPPGTASIDIMVYDDRLQVHRNIQVKTRSSSRPNGAWVMNQKHETPIAGLYLGSASAHPGGGVHGAPGSNAARAAIVGERRRKLLPGR